MIHNQKDTNCLISYHSKINKSRNLDSQHEKQAIEIVRSMPQWIPGKIGNTIVRVETVIVVGFNCK